MKSPQLILVLAVFCFDSLNAQVGVGTTTPNATLDIRSSNQAAPANTDGILIPKADELPTTDPTAGQDGMLIYVTGNGNETKGFYYWDQSLTDWVNTIGSKQINDLIDGRTDGNVFGSSLFLGYDTGLNDDGTSNSNVGIGHLALYSNVSGYNNVAIGNRNLNSNLSGYGNIGIGSNNLGSNIDGTNNLGIGYNTLASNTSGYSNIAIGVNALNSNTTGYSNIAVGESALSSNIVGLNNIAIGSRSLLNNTANNNIAIGSTNLLNNTTGGGNLAIGNLVLLNNINGARNIAIGHGAGYNELGSSKLYIENSDADPDNALIYGEFGTDSSTTGNILRTNGEFQIGNPSLSGYAFPTTDGSVNQVLQTDGSGALSWVDNSAFGVQRLNDLIDGKSDNDGSEDGSSVYIGAESGLNDNELDNRNIGFGFQALKFNSSGKHNAGLGYVTLGNSRSDNNTAVGAFSLANNFLNNSNNVSVGAFSGIYNRGSRNVFVGTNAGRGILSGSMTQISGCVFIGYEAGRDVTTDNKLHITNGNATQPLIYGEFDNYILGLNGSVAIGHQSPNAKLHALEEGTTGDQTIVAILESNTSNRPTLLFSDDTTPTINSGMSIEYNGVNNHIALNNVGGTSLYQFSNDGDFTIQDGDLIIEDPGVDKQLRMMDNTGNADRVIIRQNSTNDIYMGDLDDNNGDLFFRAGGNSEMVIENGGQVGINTLNPNYNLEVNGSAAKPGGGMWIASSDKRLKQNIQDYNRGLEDVLKIKPVTFNYNSKSRFDIDKNHVGVVAQELKKILPEMVIETDTNEKYLAVDNSAMTYMLINAIKEQQNEIKQLKKEIALIKSLIKTD